MSHGPISVLLVDDHAVIREGMKSLLAESPGITVVGEAANGVDALIRVRELAPQVVVLDLNLPGRDGQEVLESIKRSRNRTAVLVVSFYREDQYALRVLERGADGYLAKEEAATLLPEAIRKVAGGGKYITPPVAELLAVRADPTAQAKQAPHQRLSSRELEVLRHLAAGRTVTEVAARLTLSPKTISTHRARVLRKLALENNAELIRYALQHGLAE